MQWLKNSKYTIPKPKPPRDWVWKDFDKYDGLFISLRYGERLSLLLEHWLSFDLQILKTDQGYFVLFDNPIEINPREVGAALPLKKSSTGGWTSYPEAPTPSKYEVAIFYSGKADAISIDDAEYIDPYQFWELPQYTIIPNIALPTIVTPPAKITRVKKNEALSSSQKEVNVVDQYRDELAVQPNFVSNFPAAIGRLFRFGIRFSVTIFFFVIIAGLVLVLFSAIGSTMSSVDQAANNITPLVSSILIGIGIFLAIRWLIKASGLRVFGEPSGGSSQHGTERKVSHAPSAPKKAGLASKLAGWLLWNTPAGDKLRRDYEARVAETEKMINQGRIDEALKKALALGNSDKPPSSLATRLPKDRSSLDINYHGQSGSSSLMGTVGFASITARYQKLAKELEKQTDYQKAAFVLTELLGNHIGAIDVLKRGKLYEDAAKLATARNLSVDQIAVLWFMAGKRDLAILAAKRHDSMASLATTAEAINKDAGRYFRAVWADHLAELGDYANALLVTDKLHELEAQRLLWITQAISEQQIENPTIFHRAITHLPWNVRALETGYTPSQNQIGGQIELQLQACFDDNKLGIELLDYLVNTQTSKHQVAENFFPMRASILVDKLVRTCISKGHDLNSKRLHAWSGLAKRSNLPLLAQDLTMIRRSFPNSKVQNKASHLELPPTGINKTPWTHVIALPRERAFVANDLGFISIINKQGHKEWSDYVSEFAGAVKIHSGRYILLILGDGELKRVIRLDTLNHNYVNLGKSALTFWHNIATENIWLVLAQKRFQAINVSGLLTKEPEFEELWGTTIIDEVQVLTMFLNHDKLGWYTQRKTKDGFGIIEKWSAHKSSLEFNMELIGFPKDGTYKNTQYANPYEEALGMNSSSLFQLAPKKQHSKMFLVQSEYSFENEKMLNASLRKKYGALNSAACFIQFPSDYIYSEMNHEDTPFLNLHINDGQFHLKAFGVNYQAFDLESGKKYAFFSDTAGRLIWLDLKENIMLDISTELV